MSVNLPKAKRNEKKHYKEKDSSFSSSSVLAFSGFHICQISDKKLEPNFQAGIKGTLKKFN